MSAENPNMTPFERSIRDIISQNNPTGKALTPKVKHLFRHLSKRVLRKIWIATLDPMYVESETTKVILDFTLGNNLPTDLAFEFKEGLGRTDLPNTLVIKDKMIADNYAMLKEFYTSEGVNGVIQYLNLASNPIKFTDVTILSEA